MDDTDCGLIHPGRRLLVVGSVRRIIDGFNFRKPLHVDGVDLGDLYVAERKKQRVPRFSSKGKKKGTFIDVLPDMPEFLVYVP